jgi:hypothetical protein
MPNEVDPQTWRKNVIAKTQAIRVLDVVLIGPLMVWGGWNMRKKAPLPANALAAIGVATIIFNGYNYLWVKDEDGGAV